MSKVKPNKLILNELIVRHCIRVSQLLILSCSYLLTANIAEAGSSEVLKCVESVSQMSLEVFQSRKNSPFVNCPSLEGPHQFYQKSHVDKVTTADLAENLELVGNCFEQSWKKSFAKLSSESGLHIDIIGANLDAGIGQLTSIAIIDVQDHRNLIWQRLRNSQNKSCQILTEKINSFGVSRFFNFPAHEKCQVIYGDLGLMRNLVFSASLNDLNYKYVNNAINTYHIKDLLIKAGYTNTSLDMISEMLIQLSYNNGGKSSVRDLKNFLESRIDFIERKRKELPRYKLSKDEQAAFLSYVNADDFDFTLGQKKYEAWEKRFKNNLNKAETRIALKNISSSELGFPEWLRIWQSNGGPGYMNGVYLTAKKISEANPECVDMNLFKIQY